MKRARRILFQFLFIFLSFSFFGAKRVDAAASGTAIIWQERDDIDGNPECNVYSGCAQAGVKVKGYVKDLKDKDGNPVPNGTTVDFEWDWKPGTSTSRTATTYQNGKTGTFQIPNDTVSTGRQYRIKVYISGGGTFTSGWSAETEDICDEDLCITNLENAQPFEICDQIKKDTEEYAACLACFAGQDGIWTAIGCIPKDPTAVVGSLVQIGLGIAGGIVLIMILVGAFMLSTSQGDPKKTQEAKEIITSAIIGLIFIIFSVTILQFIGVNILQIPGFGA